MEGKRKRGKGTRKGEDLPRQVGRVKSKLHLSGRETILAIERTKDRIRTHTRARNGHGHHHLFRPSTTPISYHSSHLSTQPPRPPSNPSHAKQPPSTLTLLSCSPLHFPNFAISH